MKLFRINIITVFLICLFPVCSFADNNVEFIRPDIATLLMNSTFKIEGGNVNGTSFLIGKKIKNSPQEGYYVLVTAAHVIESIGGDSARLYLRKKEGEKYKKYIINIPIRNNGKPLWIKHPTSDVAAMYISLPPQTHHSFLSETFLADDIILKAAEIHPGDKLFALGFPFGAEANDAGFPILRGGVVSSYPITPTKQYPELLFDFEVRRGNSGSPVIFMDEDRPLKGGKSRGKFEFIIGLVSHQTTISENIQSLFQSRQEEHLINLAIIVPAAIIRETIELLPPR